MNLDAKRLLFWAPRVLSIHLALFLSVFALDVFGEGYSFGETLLALLIHLAPNFMILIALAIAWRREWVGAVLFSAMGLFLLVASGGESWFISVPLLLIGALFLFNWIYRAELKTR